jgi:HPt (histidine-containing phosphotransfer) domain-containing protein
VAVQRLRAGLDGVRDPALPVIALTANVSAEERQRFLEAGASAFLAKPIDEHELHNEVARQLDGLLARGVPLVGERLAPPPAVLDAMFGVGTAAATTPAPDAGDKLYHAMRAAFLAEGPRLLEVAQRGAGQGDATAVALAAHSLMGAAAFLGADALHARCAQIEKLADAGELPALPPHLAALAQELAQVLADMAAEPAAHPAIH